MVAALPLADVAEVMLAILAVCAVMVVATTIYELNASGQRVVVTWPLIGGQLASAFGWLASHVRQWAVGFDSFVVQKTVDLARAIHSLLSAALGWAFQSINSQISAVQGAERQVSAAVYGNALPRVGQLEARAGAIERELSRDVQVHLARLDAETRSTASELAGNVLPRLRALEGVTARLSAFEGMLRSLAAIAGGPAAAIVAVQLAVGVLAQDEKVIEQALRQLRTDLTADETMIRHLAGDLAKVMPLAGVAALGAAAISNVESLAKDPCFCLNSGDFSDLEGRVSMLEVGAL